MARSGKKREMIYAFICSYIEENSFPPTVREIGAAVGLSSTSTVHTHMKILEEKGLISTSPSKQRTISINEKPDTAARNRRVPLIGRVTAGNPILAVDNIEGYYSMPPALLRGAEDGEVFMLSVEGESMIEAGINDGDVIIVHRGIDAANGDIVVARVSGESATVKRIFREGATVRLQPENSAMAPIIVPAADVEIAGRVIGLYRNY